MPEMGIWSEAVRPCIPKGNVLRTEAKANRRGAGQPKVLLIGIHFHIFFKII
jgi:hypothetical protein